MKEGDAVKSVLENQGYEGSQIFSILWNLFKVGLIPLGLWYITKYSFENK